MADFYDLIGFAAMCWISGFGTSYKILAFKRFSEVIT